MRAPAPPAEIDAAPYRDASINQKVKMRIAVASDKFVDSNLHERMQDRRSRVRLRM